MEGCYVVLWCIAVSLTTAVSPRYIVLPYYEQTLGAYMATFVDAGTLPPEREVLLLLTQLCQALVHLQRNHVVHHDIKVCVCSALRVTALLLTH